MRRVSVAMCTFNGAKYLAEQLHSILQQSMPATEIICCDDGSTDDTIVILEACKEQYPGLFRVIQNEQQLGPRKNFEKAISLCTGDLIFLCDQDDQWYVNKIEETVSWLEQNPVMLGVFSNGQLMNKEGQNLEESMWDALYFEPAIRGNIKNRDLLYYILLNGNIATGTTMAIRKESLPFLLPFYTGNNTWHDHWIALVLSAMGKLGFIDKSLMKYRVHDKQQVGFPGRRKSNPSFREAVHQTWFQQADPASLATQSAHLAWALQAWERFSPHVAGHIMDLHYWQETGQRIHSLLSITKENWLRQLPWFTRKIKLLKHWLKGGEYLRISFYDLIRI